MRNQNLGSLFRRSPVAFQERGATYIQLTGFVRSGELISIVDREHLKVGACLTYGQRSLDVERLIAYRVKGAHVRFRRAVEVVVGGMRDEVAHLDQVLDRKHFTREQNL